MIAVIALLSIGMIFTYSYAKKNVTGNADVGMNGGTPPSMPTDGNMSKTSSSLT